MKLAFNLNDEQSKQFDTYFHKLIEYNEKVNLTAITEQDEVYIKHFHDSLLGAEFIKKDAKVVDIGTGAGFPGLPLKIFRKDIFMTLVDSLNKRVEFLKNLSTELNLKCECVHSRAEDFALNNREKFDVVVSRAVAKLNVLAEYCLPLIKVGGEFIAYKGSNIDEEILESKKAVSILGGVLKEIKHFDLPNNMGERNLIIIKKIKETPKKYPRGKNLPKTKPIV